jgi:hypothetical protein
MLENRSVTYDRIREDLGRWNIHDDQRKKKRKDAKAPRRKADRIRASNFTWRLCGSATLR